MSISSLFVNNNYELNCKALNVNNHQVSLYDGITDTVNITSYPPSDPVIDEPINVTFKKFGAGDKPDIAYIYIPAFTFAEGKITVNTDYFELDISDKLSYLPAPNFYNTQLCTIFAYDGSETTERLGTIIAKKDGDKYFIRIYAGIAAVTAEGVITPPALKFESGRVAGLTGNVLFSYIQAFK